MKKIIIILLLAVSVNFAQSDKDSGVKIGFEIDALPYLTGGHYFSVWTGMDNLRLRAVYTNFNAPSFIIPEGFEDQETNAYTLLVDYFPLAEKGTFEKLWIGVGLEYWKNSVKNSASKIKGNYDNLIFTFGGGYVWKIWGNFYLNPWAACHIALNGTEEKTIGGAAFEPKAFLYEASLKLGWYF